MVDDMDDIGFDCLGAIGSRWTLMERGVWGLSARGTLYRSLCWGVIGIIECIEQYDTNSQIGQGFFYRGDSRLLMGDSICGILHFYRIHFT